MRPSHRVLLGVLLVCVLAAAIRSMPAASSPRLYGFDPYVHYHFASYAVEHGRAAPVDGFRDGLLDDRAYWPGLHLLAGGTGAVTGAGLLGVFEVLPQFLGTLAVLLVFLVSRRMLGTGAALAASALYAVADHAVFQSSWLVQETLGVVLFITFVYVITQTRPTRRWEGAALLVLVYLASLASHHLSHAVLLATFLVAALAAPRRDERDRLLGAFLGLLPLTVAWWAVVGVRTWSFPDIVDRMGGVLASPYLVLSVWATVLAVAAARTLGLAPAGAAAALRGVAVRWARWLDRDRWRLSALALGVLAATAAGLLAYGRAFATVPGLGADQVTKYALASLGSVGAVALVARGVPRTGLLLGLAAVLAAGFALVLTVLTFLPLQLRFFDYVYVPMAVLSGAGLARLAGAPPFQGAPAQVRARPARRLPRPWAVAPHLSIAVLVALMSVAAMSADDYARAASPLVERYYHSGSELEAARWIRDNTEPDAVVCAPFGVQPVVFTVGERMADTYVMTKCIEGGGWTSAAYEFIVLAKHSVPTYVYLTTDGTKYGPTEQQGYGLPEIYRLGMSFRNAPMVFQFKYLNGETMIFKLDPTLLREEAVP